MELVNSTRKTNWKFGSNVLLSSAGYFNLLFLAALFPRKYLMDYLDYLQIDFSGSEYLTNASLGANISGIFFIINYFLIFRKDRSNPLLTIINITTASYFWVILSFQFGFQYYL
jgi:hypothetical protein